MKSESHSFTVLCLADLHGAASQVKPIIEHAGSVDLILLAGDITHFGKRADAEAIIALFDDHTPLLAVPGNCDFPEVDAFLNQRGIGLHKQCKPAGGLSLIGLGTSLPCPGRTPNESTDEEMAVYLEEAAEGLKENTPFLLLSHQPPFHTCNDRVLFGRHVGSRSIRRFIERFQPLACLTGHIHEGACMDAIGGTVIANAGPAKNGNYVIARFDDQKPVIALRNSHNVS